MFRLWMRALFSLRGVEAGLLEEEPRLLIDLRNNVEFLQAKRLCDRLSEVVGVSLLLCVLVVYSVAMARGDWPERHPILLVVALLACQPVVRVGLRPPRIVSVSLKAYRFSRMAELVILGAVGACFLTLAR
jgi:hypothetical protein